MTKPSPPWRVSSYSSDGGTCLAVAGTPSAVLLRNSNHIELGALRFDRPSIAAFVAGCKTGQFDDLADLR